MTIDEKDLQGTSSPVQVLTMLVGGVTSPAVCDNQIAARFLTFCAWAGQILAVIGLMLMIVTGESIKGPDTTSVPQEAAKGALQACYMDSKSKLGRRLVDPARQSMTSKKTGTVGEKDECHVEIEEAMIDEEDGEFSNGS